ncbi:MAG: TPM domain-containing protein [bacterium]
MNFGRILRHLWTPQRSVHRAFPKSVMTAIGAAVKTSESQHRGQIRFAVESVLDWRRLVRDVPPPERALEVFSRLRVWDTAENNGVLIYLLLADRHVEIVADRGIHARVGTEGWELICRCMEQNFSAGHFEEGILRGIQEVTEILVQEYPSSGPANNELPDEPVLLK